MRSPHFQIYYDGKLLVEGIAGRFTLDYGLGTTTIDLTLYPTSKINEDALKEISKYIWSEGK